MTIGARKNPDAPGWQGKQRIAVEGANRFADVIGVMRNESRLLEAGVAAAYAEQIPVLELDFVEVACAYLRPAPKE